MPIAAGSPLRRYVRLSFRDAPQRLINDKNGFIELLRFARKNGLVVLNTFRYDNQLIIINNHTEKYLIIKNVFILKIKYIIRQFTTNVICFYLLHP